MKIYLQFINTATMTDWINPTTQSTYLREIRDEEAENAELEINGEWEQYEVSWGAHVPRELRDGLLDVPVLQVQIIREERDP